MFDKPRGDLAGNLEEHVELYLNPKVRKKEIMFSRCSKLTGLSSELSWQNNILNNDDQLFFAPKNDDPLFFVLHNDGSNAFTLSIIVAAVVLKNDE